VQTRTVDWPLWTRFIAPSAGMTTRFVVFANPVNSVKYTAHVEKNSLQYLYSVVYVEYCKLINISQEYVTM
jgi:hypothetical protein